MVSIVGDGVSGPTARPTCTRLQGGHRLVVRRPFAGV